MPRFSGIMRRCMSPTVRELSLAATSAVSLWPLIESVISGSGCCARSGVPHSVSNAIRRTFRMAFIGWTYNASTARCADQPAGDRLEYRVDVAYRGQQLDFHAGVLGTQRVKDFRQVVLEMPALGHEQRRYGDGQVTGQRQFRHGVRQSGLHELQECQFDGDAGAPGFERALDFPERLRPPGIAGAVSE